MNIAIDTNVIISAVATWQASHRACRGAIDRLAAENTLIVPLRALARGARAAGAEAILTMNVRHFEKLGEGLQVLSP